MRTGKYTVKKAQILASEEENFNQKTLEANSHEKALHKNWHLFRSADAMLASSAEL